jgi:hypothetical protein
MEAENPRAVSGGNNPPTLAEELASRHKDLFALVEPLAQRANAQPKVITSDAENFALGTVVKDATAAIKSLEDARVAEKEPYLRGGQEVDGTFNAPKGRLTKIVAGLSARADTFAHEKKMEARRKAQEEEKKLRDEEERQRRMAQLDQDFGNYEAAEERVETAASFAHRADHAASTSVASTPDLTRSRSDEGMVATASDKWTFRVADWSKVDIAALRPFIPIDVLEKALRRHIGIHKGAMPIAGVEFVEGTKASFR